MKGKLTKLESLRGFAALYVVGSHLFDQECLIFDHNIAVFFKFGREAVMLFFILSGFVIQYAFNRSKDKSFQTYFKKRFFRIYIPLIIVFIISYILYLLFSPPKDFVTWKHLIGNLLMLQDVSAMKPNTITEPFLGNNPLWSLSYEWWFYMMYFFIDKYCKDKAFLVVSALAIISSLSYIFYPFFINRLFMYLIIWWAGVEMAKLYANNLVISIANIKFLLLVLIACLGLIFVDWYTNYRLLDVQLVHFLEFRHMAFAIVVILFAIVWKRYHWFMFNNTLGLFTLIAPISYTIYISHYFLVIVPEYLFFLQSKVLQTIIGLAICLLFSYLVEMKIYPFLMKYVKFTPKKI